MRLLLATTTCCALVALLPAAAAGSPNQESILMDQEDLIRGDDATAALAVGVAKSLGVTRLRISISWNRVAPDPDGLRRPKRVNLRDPRSYDQAAFRPYDRAIRLAREAGLRVYLNLNGFAPRWATPARKIGRLDQIYKISPLDWERFVTAVGRRYNGKYVPPGESRPVPRVWTWSLYNEPNQGGWLAPQFQHSRTLGKRIPYSPRLYRRLLRSGHRGLKASGHARDTLLIGELAPSGRERRGQQSPMRPLLFLRELFCLDSRYRPYRGRQARARGCTGLEKLPGTVFAHHPYGLTLRPDQRPGHRDDIPLSVISRLSHVLDRAARYGRVKRGMPIWNTEFGWQTRPDPYLGIPTRRHAEYMMRAEYMSWRNPRLRTFSQYLLRDEPKRRTSDSGIGGLLSDRQRWGSWQSGLFFERGRPKPAARAFELPIQPVWTRRGFRVWGMVRPGSGRRTVQLEHRPAGGGGYRRVGGSFRVGGRGYFLRKVSFRAGRWRLVWKDAPGRPMRSLSVAARSRARGG